MVQQIVRGCNAVLPITPFLRDYHTNIDNDSPVEFLVLENLQYFQIGVFLSWVDVLPRLNLVLRHSRSHVSLSMNIYSDVMQHHVS